MNASMVHGARCLVRTGRLLVGLGRSLVHGARSLVRAGRFPVRPERFPVSGARTVRLLVNALNSPVPTPAGKAIRVRRSPR